jgi:hypothetical protein
MKGAERENRCAHKMLTSFLLLSKVSPLCSLLYPADNITSLPKAWVSLPDIHSDITSARLHCDKKRWKRASATCYVHGKPVGCFLRILLWTLSQCNGRVVPVLLFQLSTTP